MDIGLKDTMPLGKYKGSKIEDIYRDEAEYLVWFRQARKDQNQDSKFFSLEVSALLDMTIEGSKQLQKKYKPWNLAAPITAPVRALTTPGATEYRAWGAF